MTDEELIARLRDEHVAASRTEAADRIEALVKERDAAIESVSNNNDWFGCCMDVWSWLIAQPDMPDLDLKDGGAEECVANYKIAITALIKARTERLEAVLREIIDEDQHQSEWRYWEKEDGHWARKARAAMKDN